SDSEALNEERWVDIVNDLYGAREHKVKAVAQEFWNDLPEIIRKSGEPIGGMSQYVQWKVFEAIQKEGCDVVLDGVGGDGVTAGHAYYVVDKLMGNLRAVRVRAAI